MASTGERDEYGMDRNEALDLLWKYLRLTLADKHAFLLDPRLEAGRWQARVQNSQRGVETVFLHQHGGKIVGGHTSAGPGAKAAPASLAEATFRHLHQAEGDQDETLANQRIPVLAASERRELEQEAAVHFQTLKWHEPTRHRAAPKPPEREL